MAQQGQKVISVNRKAWHDYFIDETYDAGICLVGTEVKSIRANKASIQESYAQIKNGEAWLYGMYIAPYEFGNINNPDPRRPRKLLLHKREIIKLTEKTQQKGLALIPLKIYFERGYAKIELGLARGKKLYDKRDAIAEKDAERDAKRELSSRNE
jgi:SsrA-binding protein